MLSPTKGVLQWLYLLFGRRPAQDDLVVFFSTRLDETGTDGRSAYAIVAGGVSVPEHWQNAEASWNRLLASRGLDEYHSKEWNGRSDGFAGWGDLKRKNFLRTQNKIVKKNVVISIAVAIHRDTHSQVKKRMVGIKGFHPNSDVGMCFRVARFMICDKLAQWHQDGQIPTPPKIQFIVEDGPYSADSNTVYQDVIKTVGAKYRPAKYAEMLAGFASIPHGQLRSLEIADFISGQAISDLQNDCFLEKSERLSVILTPDYLEQWYKDMLKERERRQSHGLRKPKTSSGE